MPPYSWPLGDGQGLAERDDVAPCLCGVAFGSNMVPPGEMETLTMVVTGDNCPNGPLFTMASMLGAIHRMHY